MREISNISLFTLVLAMALIILSCTRNATKPLVIAHRGARGLVAHGNTVQSFQKAVDIGAEMIEMDIRRTSDGRLAIIHDKEIAGTMVADLNYQQLVRLCKAKENFEPPLFSQVLEAFSGKVRFDIELKEAGYEKEVIEMTLGYLDYLDFIMKSFEDEAVKAIKRIDPRITVGLLVGRSKPKNKFMTRLRELFPELRLLSTNADFISPNHKLLKLGFLFRMRLMGKPVYVWTVNEPESMQRLIQKGVDAIITDRPDIAISLVNSL